MTRSDTLAFIERRMEAWRRRDPLELASHYAAACTVVSPMFATLHGRPAVEQSFRTLFTTFPDWTMAQDDLLIDGDRAVQLLTVTARHVGEFFGLPGTGRRMEFRGVTAFQLADGLIVRERRIYDFTGVLIQLGVLKGKPAR